MLGTPTDILRTEYHQVIIQISKKLRIAKEYLRQRITRTGSVGSLAKQENQLNIVVLYSNGTK
ncbi:hypothetical protein BH23PAT1_BH23PAT1_4110 [soil metagenome]